MWRKFIHEERGNTLLFAAAGLLSLLIFAAAGTDIGFILTAKNQLQSAVDAAALAGATGLMNSQIEAKSEAIHFAALNKCANTPVVVNSADVTFPSATQIRVRATRTLNTFFLRLIHIDTKTLVSEATAELSFIKGTTGMAPLCVPNGNWHNGDRVLLKDGGKGDLGTTPCWRYPVCFPPVNRGNPISGAAEYVENLKYGGDSYVEVGDVLMIEPGAIIGPTIAGISYVISQDPDARWEYDGVENSSYHGFTSPRIYIIPMYDPNSPPADGRGEVTVNAIGAFFVEGMHGNDVIGVFMNILTDGTRGTSYSLVHKVRMIG